LITTKEQQVERTVLTTVLYCLGLLQDTTKIKRNNNGKEQATNGKHLITGRVNLSIKTLFLAMKN